MIIKLIKSIIAPPVFPDDIENTNKAKAINLFLINTFIITLIVILTITFFGINKLYGYILSVSLLMLIIIFKILIHKNKIYLASLIFVTGNWILAVIWIVLSGGFQSHEKLYLMSPLVMTSVLLGKRSIITITVLNIFVLIFLYFIEYAGIKIISVFPLPLPAYSTIFSNLIVLILIITPFLISFNEFKVLKYKLAKSEEKYKTLIETTDTGYVRIDFEGKVIEANDIYVQFTGYKNIKDIIGKSVVEWTAEYDKAKNKEAVLKCKKNGIIDNFQVDYIDKKGKITSIELNASVYEMEGEKQIITLCRNITERKTTEGKLKETLEEKTILLKELYHRTKNNMMLISSLLQLQKDMKNSKSFESYVNDTVLRINSMALVHNKLYQSHNLSEIDLSEYISDLVNMLKDTYKNQKRDVQIKIKSEKINVIIDLAIPLGLVINEIVTNSFKYAFVDGCKGIISIKIMNRGNNIILEISDNGAGINNNIDIKNERSLGFMIINNIIEKQLKGNIDISSSKGVCYKISISNKNPVNKI